MNKILMETEVAYQLYLNKTLSESEMYALIESKRIDAQYLSQLQSSFLSENVLKKIATHPVTKAIVGAGALAGAAYLGHSHGFEAGHTQGFEAGHTQGVVDTSDAYQSHIEDLNKEHAKNIVDAQKTGFDNGRQHAIDHPKETMDQIRANAVEQHKAKLASFGQKIAAGVRKVGEFFKLPPIQPGGSTMLGTR